MNGKFDLKVDKSYLAEKIGKLSPEKLKELEVGVQLVLSL